MENRFQGLNDMVDGSFAGFKSFFELGEKVVGTVSAITNDFIFVDVNAKSEGIIERHELEKKGELTIKKGDTIEAFFVSSESGGQMLLTMKLKSRNMLDESIADAYASRIPVEGRIASEKKGGFEVIVGSQKAFCPYSQMDIFPAADNSIYIGQRHSFIITEYNDSNLVVSRRVYLQQESDKKRKQLQETLKEGDNVEGIVRKIMDFGVFVDIGGIDGLIPMSELSWARVKDAGEVLRVGEMITVKVLNIQWDNERVALSLRKVGGDPWGRVEDNYHVTKQYNGTVTKLMEFGAFVALEPGIEGLLHISRLGAGKRLKHAAEVLKEDQDICVFIEGIDLEKRRISLALENPQIGRTMDVEGNKMTIGESVTGTVDDIKQFGVFIKLSPTKSGLLHISEIPFNGQVNKMKEMHNRFPPGSEVTVVIKNIHMDKISLSLPESRSEDQDEFHKYNAEKKESDNFGSLGSAFDKIKF